MVYLFILFIALLPLTARAHGAEPELSTATSEIPARREFPIAKEIEPCRDFYEYACKNVNQSFKLREDRSRHVFAFSDSSERILERKKAFLKDLQEKNKRNEPLTERSHSLATVYSACMNDKARALEEKNYVAETMNELAKIKNHKDFQGFLASRRENGQISFLDLGSIANADSPDIYDFYFMVNFMSLPERSYYEKRDVERDFIKVAEEFFITLKVDQPSRKAREIWKLEKAFAKVNPLPEEWRSILVQRSEISRQDIIKKYPNFFPESFLNRLPSHTKIRHFSPKTLGYAHQILGKSDLVNLKNLYLFHALASELDDAYPAFQQSFYSFRVKHLGESPVRPSRDERCAKIAMVNFGKELDAEVLPLLFPNFPEERFIGLAEKIRTSILEGLQTNSWLSPEGKAAAIEKIKVARLQLVKPKNDEEWDFNPPAQYFIDRPMENDRILTAKLDEKMFLDFTRVRNKDIWDMAPLTVNAYYSPEDNKFVLPIGILQYPFYDAGESDATNLGAVGVVIGHELGHGIDDQGSRYDGAGRLKDWMSKGDLEEFRKRGNRFVEQYDRIRVNGKFTLGENIGDLTGLTFAYRAAFPDNKGSSEEKRNFFLQYARVWCTVIRPQFAEQLLKVDEHAPNWARVNQQLKNQAGFAEAYECKKGDPMYLPAEDRVVIW